MRVFKNAQFISCEEENRIFQYLVEDGGRIVFTGNRLSEQYFSCDSLDLQGRCVIPAFVDTHLHFASFAFFYSGLDCRHVSDFDELAYVVRRYLACNSEKKIFLAFGCSAHTVKERRLPTRADLDKITTRPLMIIKYDGHAAVGNTSLIKKMSKDILSDPGFHAETGWFHLNAFYRAVNAITKSVSLSELFLQLAAGCDGLAYQGIALAHTAEGVGFPLDLDVDFMRLANRGFPLDFRVFFQTMDIRKITRRKLPRIGGCFATALDGCFGSEDAALLQPYSNNSGNFGQLFYTQKQVNEFAISANREGLQIALHAIGDGAISQALSAFEAALADFPRTDHRHILIHADLMDESTIERAAKLGVCIALQTPFLHWPQEPLSYLKSILGSRIDNLIPLKSMRQAGITLASGSDAPCTPPDPISGIFAACNHPNSEQSVNALEAIRMHTAAGALLSFEEASRGTLTEGKQADFVVLNANPLDLPPNRLNTLKVETLYLKGEKYRHQSDKSFGRLLMDALANRGGSLKRHHRKSDYAN
ncbi:MAG TPA: amidohydrolase family protein [Smithellaceae bacterium]|nr:amidohydrolase family protein [Smithellaceae bacterium]